MNNEIDINLSIREKNILKKNKWRQETRKTLKKDSIIYSFIIIAGMIIGIILFFKTDLIVFSIILPLISIILAIVLNENRKKFDKEVEGLLIKIEKNIREIIINKFNEKFSNIKEKKENLSDLVNLINNKTGLELSNLDVYAILVLNEKEADYRVFYEKVKNIDFKNEREYAEELMKIYKDIEFSYIKTDKQKLNIFREMIEKNVIDEKKKMNIDKIGEELYRIYKQERSEKFEEELNK